MRRRISIGGGGRGGHGDLRRLGVRLAAVVREQGVAVGRLPRRAEPADSQRADAVSGEPSAGTTAPARSSSSRKRTAPSPTASEPGSIRAGQRLGRERDRLEHAAAAAANTSPRRASITATHAAPSLRAPAASAARLETPTSGRSRAWASARAVAMPSRRPVKPPGPTPTAIRSTASQPRPRQRPPRPARAGGSRGAGRSPGGGSSRPRQPAAGRPQTRRRWPAWRCRSRGSRDLDPALRRRRRARAGRGAATRSGGHAPGPCSGHSTNAIASGAKNGSSSPGSSSAIPASR